MSIGNLNGTTNQVSVSGGTGAIIGAGVTLSLPQNITIPGSIATQNSVLDNGSGNMTLGGYLGLLGSRQYVEGYFGSAISNNNCLVVGFDTTNKFGYIQQYGDSPGNGIKILYGGQINTKNNILDDGSGNMTLPCTAPLLTPFQIIAEIYGYYNNNIWEPQYVVHLNTQLIHD